jgi:flagellar M-ring protein FliF
MKLPETLAAMPMRAKAGLAAGALAVVVALFLLLRMAGAPSYTLLASGLDPADSAKITAALDDQAIAYELRANGTSIAVEKAMVGRARLALAEKGVSAATGGGGPGFELFDQQKLGASDFQQKVAYQRALEGEIARTINSVSGVSGAKVQLVMPEDDLFADTATPATAAVLLQGPGDALEPGAVRGIAQLVASSVKGLKTADVTITDGTGQLLWPTGDGTGAGGTGATTKQAAEARYAAALESNIDAMLTRTLGPGKAQVEIHADLDMDKVTRDELRYEKKGVPLETTSDVEKLRGSGAAAGGTTGTAGNIPQYAAGGGGSSGNSRYQHKTKSTKFGVGKTVAKVEQAPGSVRRLNVALMLDKSVAAQAPAIQAAVAAAAGLDPARGDQITQATVAFPAPQTPKAGPVPETMIGPIKWGLLGLAALVFAFFTWRFLRRRESEPLAEPAWLREITEPVRLAELERGPGIVASTAPTVTLPTRRRDESMQKLDQLVEREPERVAAQVRQWMSEEMP